MTFSGLQFSHRVTVLSLLLWGRSGAGFWSLYSTISTVISILFSSGRLLSRTSRFGSCHFHSIKHHTSPLSCHFWLLIYPYTLDTSTASHATPSSIWVTYIFNESNHHWLLSIVHLPIVCVCLLSSQNNFFYCLDGEQPDRVKTNHTVTRTIDRLTQ